jgi:hypothetical protein
MAHPAVLAHAHTGLGGRHRLLRSAAVPAAAAEQPAGLPLPRLVDTDRFAVGDPAALRHLEREGFCVLRGALGPAEVG